jgi:hypothetical protein
VLDHQLRRARSSLNLWRKEIVRRSANHHPGKAPSAPECVASGFPQVQAALSKPMNALLRHGKSDGYYVCRLLSMLLNCLFFSARHTRSVYAAIR